MKTFWYIILMVNAILIFFVLPAGMWFYEAEDENWVSQFHVFRSSDFAIP